MGAGFGLLGTPEDTRRSHRTLPYRFRSRVIRPSAWMRKASGWQVRSEWAPSVSPRSQTTHMGTATSVEADESVLESPCLITAPMAVPYENQKHSTSSPGHIGDTFPWLAGSSGAYPGLRLERPWNL